MQLLLSKYSCLPCMPSDRTGTSFLGIMQARDFKLLQAGQLCLQVCHFCIAFLQSALQRRDLLTDKLVSIPLHLTLDVLQDTDCAPLRSLSTHKQSLDLELLAAVMHLFRIIRRHRRLYRGSWYETTDEYVVYGFYAIASVLGLNALAGEHNGESSFLLSTGSKAEDA